ncbi:MAG: hypothetical protein Kow0077_22950 [Anaerolineae bacterium]
MHGNFSRKTFRRNKHYVGVQLEQGRVLTDATLNEEQAIRQYHEETAHGDIIGPSGAPRENAGFGLTASGASVIIGAGRYYVDGILVENEQDLNYNAQPGVRRNLRNELRAALRGNAPGILGLVVLDVWQRYVNALEDDLLREKALGGPDDSGRIQTAWRVDVVPLPSVDAGNLQNELAPLLEQRDTLQARLRRTPRRQRPALRREIAALTEAIDAVLEAAGITCDADFREARDLIGLSTGQMAARTTDEAVADPSCALPAEGGFQGLENQLYRVQIFRGGTRSRARFVWSRENGSVVERITAFDGVQVTLQSMGRDRYMGFGDVSSYSFVEIFNDETEARGEPGELIRVVGLGDDPNTLKLASAPGNTDLTLNPRIRRWDQTEEQAGNNGLMRMNQGEVELENGVYVEFSSGTFRPGDYWLIPARTAPVSDVEWEPAGMHPPDGVAHHYARLGLVYLARGSNEVQVLTDCRAIFPPLTGITADDVAFDDSQCEINASTVQEAIDALCGAQRGMCTVTLRPGADVEAALVAIPQGADAMICFATGDYALQKPIELTNLGHLKIVGAGWGTRLLAASGVENALVASNCKSVVIRDLHAQTTASNVGDELGGTLEFNDCGQVTVENTSLQCGHGVSRRAACIKVLNTRTRVNLNTGTATIRNNRLVVGHLQSGILLVNAPRAVVAGNQLMTYARPSTFRLEELAPAANPHYLNPLINNLLVNVTAVDFVREQPGTPSAPAPADQPDITTAPADRPDISSVPTRRNLPRMERLPLNTAFLSERLALDAASLERFSVNVPLTERLRLEIVSPDPLLDENDWGAALRDEAITINELELVEEGAVHELLRTAARNILVNAGRVGPAANNWAAWFDRAVNDDASVMGQGIVIGGEVSEDVHIVENTIQTCIQGIHVGLSRSGSRSVQLMAEAVLIANNTVEVAMPTAAVRERHGIFVGNVRSLLLTNNTLKIRRYATTSQLSIDAIRVWGEWGARVDVLNNHVHNSGSNSFTYGVRMNPLTGGGKQQRWRVAENIASVIVSGEFPSTVTVRDNIS